LRLQQEFRRAAADGAQQAMLKEKAIAPAAGPMLR
jgi:hypothetical protein